MNSVSQFITRRFTRLQFEGNTGHWLEDTGIQYYLILQLRNQSTHKFTWLYSCSISPTLEKPSDGGSASEPGMYSDHNALIQTKTPMLVMLLHIERLCNICCTSLLLSGRLLFDLKPIVPYRLLYPNLELLTKSYGMSWMPFWLFLEKLSRYSTVICNSQGTVTRPIPISLPVLTAAYQFFLECRGCPGWLFCGFLCSEYGKWIQTIKSIIFAAVDHQGIRARSLFCRICLAALWYCLRKIRSPEFNILSNNMYSNINLMHYSCKAHSIIYSTIHPFFISTKKHLKKKHLNITVKHHPLADWLIIHRCRCIGPQVYHCNLSSDLFFK